MDEILLENVEVRYGDFRALKDINLRLPAGQVTSIVGESGCGKSTLLQTVNGLIPISAGRINALGTDLQEADKVALRRRIGFAVQDGALFPHLKVRKNMALSASLEGWSSDMIERRLLELLALLELEPDMLDRYPHELSGGQQQRVSLGRALMLDPELLLLDEPFSAIDPITRIRIHDWFRKLMNETKKSVVLITHDLREARKLGDYLVVMRDGQALQAGTFEEVQADPATEYVARLLEEQLQ